MSLQRLLPISPGRRQNLVDDAKALAAAGCTQMILREPQRSRWDIEQCLPSLKKLLPGLILHATNVNAWRFAEIHQTGLHLPSHVDPALWRGRFPGRLGISCHSEEEVAAADAAGLDYALISPIFAPISKREDTRPPLGPKRAQAMQTACSIPLFGLGGMHPEHLDDCTGLFGGASLGYLFGERTRRSRMTARARGFLDALKKNS